MIKSSCTNQRRDITLEVMKSTGEIFIKCLYDMGLLKITLDTEGNMYLLIPTKDRILLNTIKGYAAKMGYNFL